MIFSHTPWLAGGVFHQNPREVCGEEGLSAEPVAFLFLLTLLAGWTGVKSRFSFFFSVKELHTNFTFAGRDNLLMYPRL